MTFRMTDPYRIDFEPFVVDSDNGRTIATITYALYIAGFFTGVTALVGVLLAYLKRGGAGSLARSHFDWQIRIFWRGVVAGIIVFALHWLVVGLAAITFGIGFIFMVVPWVIGLFWLVWTIWAIIKGLQHLGRGQPIR